MTIDPFADWLGRHSPVVYRLARPVWRFVVRAPRGPGYWEQRRDYKYYQEVIRLARVYVPYGKQVIDVGANDTEVLRQLDWFKRRVALDVRYFVRQRGIETIAMDFMNYKSTSDFDLVLCLQVLEHLEEPAAFAKKVLETGRTAIISVPYLWAKGTWKTHIQDPVDEVKLELWTQRKPIETRIIEDLGMKRLIAVY